MNKIVCKYAIVRFSPFIETGEFANVGIVMITPKQSFFGFKLETKRYARITHFFDDIDAKVYKKTLNNLKEEMQRVTKMFEIKEHSPEFNTNIFNEIIRRREAIIHFSKVRTVLTDNPKKQLDMVFSYYIERNFITKKYKELLLESNIRKLLNSANLENKFSKESVGDSVYHVAFPFVQQLKNQSKKIIKPLYLGHDESTKIYDHGAKWVFKITKLQEKNILREKNVLFSLVAPDTVKGNRFLAYKEIESDLLKTGVHAVLFTNDDNKILEFAKSIEKSKNSTQLTINLN